MLNIQPADKRVIIKPIKQDEMKNGLYLPETSKQPSHFFEVERSNSDLFQHGDKVLPMRHAGNRFEHEGQEYTIVHEDEILAKLE